MRACCLLLLLLLPACDVPSTPPDNEVTIRLVEMRFEASQTTFKAGRGYWFTLRNDGTVAHEWAIVPHGDQDETRMLFEVADVFLPPGDEMTVRFTFPEPGSYDFACFLPGHYQSGMKLPVTVEP
jgi:uncharacterized cupredoxin-like copper-binding protein